MMLTSKNTIGLLILGSLVCVPWIKAGRMSFAVKVDRICADAEFQCKSRACIPQAGRCDGIRDCIDGADEAGCDLFLCKKPKWYRCKHNGNCISSSFLCDKHDDCPLGDDEENCQNYQAPHVPVTCNQFEFSCTDQTCIPRDLVCDGVVHCVDGSDETMGCAGIEKKCKGFLCKNRHCVKSHDWVCDGVDDCGDGSDEENCFAGCTLQHGKFECTDNSTCLDLKQLCDGKADCRDRSDEGGRCNSQECDSLKCPEGCKNTPRGAVCVCKEGFVYQGSSKTCEDVNECERYGLCSQGCENTPGSFRCTCVEMFRLRDDGRTCELSDSSEGLLLYATEKSISGLYLYSKHQYHVAQNLSHVTGVSYDGSYIYWTDISSQRESIERALADGSKRELLLTSGLALPEDLALDWLTGNIYISDSGKMMIAVCTNSGQHCTILIQDSTRKPRGIALYPQKGTMYYSDWGYNAMIEAANMAGSNRKVLIDKDIHWPTVLSLDWPNERLYWVDAKLKKIESIKLDGTQRMTVIGDVLKHPFSIAVFSNRIYWSDWDTKSIQSCDKFSGKNRTTLVHDRKIYGLHVYHPSIQPMSDHPCDVNPCSHICLLTSNNNYTCACPIGMSLHADRHSCLETVARQHLFMGIGNYLVKLDIQAFGHHATSTGEPFKFFISRMAFNEITGELFVADNHQKMIFIVNTETQTTRKLIATGIGSITALAFDYLGNNLYWSDNERSTVEVFSLQTSNRSIIKHYIGMEAPVGLTVLPEINKMFIALRSSYPTPHTYIAIQDITGRGTKKHVIDEKLSGDGTIQFAVDRNLRTVYWNDMGQSRIEFASYEGVTWHLFLEFLRYPVSIAIVGDCLFWTCLRSKQLYWSVYNNVGPIKKINIEKPKLGNFPDEVVLLASHPLQYFDHPCQKQNMGGCSHICVATGLNSSECVCPTGMIFSSWKNTTCIDAIDCEFKCTSGECLTVSKRCNGNTDCADGSDENGCDLEERLGTVDCRFDQFLCGDRSKCVNQKLRCDERYDCPDHSDEMNCERYDPGKGCHENQRACPDGLCIDLNSLCDGFPDCLDASDEKDCSGVNNEKLNATNCGTQMFRCISGQCIPIGWECDGTLDCTDASDEHASCLMLGKCEKGFTRSVGYCIEDQLVYDGNSKCGNYLDKVNCKVDAEPCVRLDEDNPSKFLCHRSGKCLDITVRCNGTSECPNEEDEADCSYCGAHEFQCNSGLCILKEWQCDKEVDCDDGSDEVDCVNGTARVDRQIYAVCGAGSFECKPGVCIDMSKVCDGRKDCANGKDEENGCLYACSKNDCEQECIKMPSGAICECRRGYTLADNKKSCLDVDECLLERPCAQACTNIRGSYRCSCYPGFMLRSDKVSCKAVGPRHYVLYTSYNQIRKKEDNPPSVRVLIQTNESRITSMDVDVRRQMLYFTAEHSPAIYEHDLVRNSTLVLYDDGHPDYLAVNWITGNLYFYDHSEPSIKVFSAHRRVYARVLTFPVQFLMKSLAVDPINHILFFSLMNTWIFEVPHTIIYRANLDGSHQQIVSKDIAHVTSIQCDTENRVLYVSDISTNTIKMVDYEGKLIRTVVEKQSPAVSKPIDFTLYENQAFVLNLASSTVGQCKLYGNYECYLLELNVLNSNQLLVVQESRQPMMENVCEPHTINCSLVCVPVESIGKCICHNGEPVRESEACPLVITRDVSPLNELHQRFPRQFLADPTTLEQSYMVSIIKRKAINIFLGLLTLATVMGSMVFLYMRHCHRALNNGMRVTTHKCGVKVTAEINVNQDAPKTGQKASTEQPSSLNETIATLRQFHITADAIELQNMLEADSRKKTFNYEEELRQR